MDTEAVAASSGDTGERHDVVVHCSDLHFGSGFIPRRAEDLLKSINQLKPDLVVVSGDLTMRARREQFRSARAFLEQIEARLLVIPGNHDVPLYNLFERLTTPFANYREFTEGFSAGPVDLQYASFFGMNTVNPRRHQRGKFRLLELLELEKWLAEQDADRWKLAVVHQHFANIPGHERPGQYRFGQQILERMSTAGIHGVLHGHVHYHHVASSAEFFPGMERPVVLVCAGTPTSLRTRGARPANNFNILRFYRERFEVHQCDWLQEREVFEPTRHVTFDRTFYSKDMD